MLSLKEAFVNQKGINVCEYTLKMIPPLYDKLMFKVLRFLLKLHCKNEKSGLVTAFDIDKINSCLIVDNYFSIEYCGKTARRL
jgi:hypothetical protein